MPLNQKIDKENVVYLHNGILPLEYYTADKNIDILKFSGKWIDLENIILSEVTHTHKDKYYMYILISGF